MMKEKEFLQKLRRGLGSAIVEIQKDENKAKYRDIILRLCLRNISYDWQIEGTKGFYLYSAICALDDRDYFENIIIKKFLSRCSNMLFLQLSSILYRYADDGSVIAKEAFRSKYNYFVEKKGRLSRNHSLDIDEGFQWDEVADNLFYIDGFKAFKQYAEDAGKSLCKNPENRNVYYDWFVNRAKDIFGKKRVDEYINKMYENSNAIKVLVDTIKADENSRIQHQSENKRETISANFMLEKAKESALSENPLSSIMRYRREFMNNASTEEISELINIIIQEEDETVKGILLRLFWHKSFSSEITPLLHYVQSDNELLSESAIKVLSEVKSNEIHDIAIMLLETKGLNSRALRLLVKNYKKPDDAIINSLIRKSGNIHHHVVQDIIDIYNYNRSPNAFPTLYKVYQKGECSFCRYYIVKAMNYCKVLNDEILEECLYDSYEDTRKFAKRLISMRYKLKQAKIIGASDDIIDTCLR